MSPQDEPYASDSIVTTRGGILGCTHLIHAAVVDSTGRLLYSIGHPSRTTLWRSAAKPHQALAILETGALEKYDLDEADLALMCGSHNAEDRHVERAQAILEKIGARESDLGCGPIWSLNQDVARLMVQRGLKPTPVCNNCSGKHAGMLAGSKAIGAGFESYCNPSRPMQKRVKEVVQDLCGNSEAVGWALDGCNLEAPASSLNLLAKTFAAFATAADLTSAKSSDAGSISQRTQGQSRIFDAMVKYPGLVAGEGRFCTQFMEAYKGWAIGKLGAQACFAIGFRECEATRRLGATNTLGIAVKVEDGNIEILYSAIMEILRRLQLDNEEVRKALASFSSTAILNTVGINCGELRYNFDLRKPGEKEQPITPVQSAPEWL